MARRITTKDKWKTKKWFEILSPKEFGEKPVGETPAGDGKEVVGRRIEVAASEVASGPRLNQVKLLFEVNNVAGNTAKTKLAGYEMSRGYIRSSVRRRRKRVDVVEDFDVEGNKIRVKLIATTFGKAYGSQLKKIQKLLTASLKDEIKGKNLEDVFGMILARELQEKLKDEAKKVFPMASVEIRKIDFLN